MNTMYIQPFPSVAWEQFLQGKSQREFIIEVRAEFRAKKPQTMLTKLFRQIKALSLGVSIGLNLGVISISVTPKKSYKKSK